MMLIQVRLQSGTMLTFKVYSDDYGQVIRGGIIDAEWEGSLDAWKWFLGWDAPVRDAVKALAREVLE